LQQSQEPARRVLSHRANARIHLRYRIIQDFDGAPDARQGNAYRPVIQPSYFHLIGDASFITPEAASLVTFVRVRVRNLPRGWAFVSDLEHAPLALGRLWASVTVGGDFRVIERPDAGVRVAMRGEWGFTDEAFADEVADIIAGQRRFFGDQTSPYLVTVMQLTAQDEGWRSIGGTGLGDAFAFFATPNAEAHQVTRTLAHEGLHTWVPGLIGGMPEENEAAHYWLSEGFTDFLTGRILVREGVWTPAQFAADLNEALAAYAQSPGRTAPNERVAAEFWRDREMQRLPYQRGRMLASIWDARLRARGHDLDDVVLEMRARAAAGDPHKAADMFPLVMEGLGRPGRGQPPRRGPPGPRELSGSLSQSR
jgi:predicted metalloprotease with PDZ domain